MACNARSTSNVVILVSFVPGAMKNVCKIKPGLVIFQVDLFQSKSSMSSKPKHFKPRSAATISRLSNHQSLHSRSTSPPDPVHDNASLNNHTSKGFSLLPFAGDGCTRKRVYEAGVGEEVEKHRTIWEIGLLDVDGGLASIELASPMRCSDHNVDFVCVTHCELLALSDCDFDGHMSAGGTIS